jgi:hypothetical protein
MFKFDCFVQDSKISGAGLGLFTTSPIKRGQIIVYPNQENQTISHAEFIKLPEDSIEFASSIRWFEDTYTVDPEWNLECYFNHSFEASCLWHLGFVFALRDLKAGDELTIDYRVLLQEGGQLEYLDAETNLPIVGLSWRDKMLFTTKKLLEIFS